MKKDIELIRKILIAIENDNGDPLEWIDLKIEGYNEATISYHIELLYQKGYIDAENLSSFGQYLWVAKSLTMDGHEFLDSIRNETVWNKVLNVIREKGGDITIEALKQLVLETTKSIF